MEDYQDVVDENVMPELRIAGVLSGFFVRLPHLAFGMFNQSGTVWKAVCDLILGEIDYAAIKRRAGGFKGIFKHLPGA